jgi:hypothetical protein
MVALLVAIGELSYQEIARQVQCHYNSITAWVRNPQVLALVAEFQQGIQDKIEAQTLEAVQRKNDLLLPKALEQLEKMLSSRSQKKQLQVIKFLLSYGKLPGGEDSQDPAQEGQSRIRLSPEARAWLKVH